MAGLSSNWKKLQAQLSPPSSSPTPSRKRQREAKPEGSQAVKRARHSTSTPAKRQAAPRPMGGVQSAGISHEEVDNGVAPSLSVWAGENDISSEAIAEAYGLGLGKQSVLSATSEKDKVNGGIMTGLEIGKYVAVDCEMVGVGPGGHDSALARVSLVDFHGRQVYDSFVKQREKVVNWRTPFSGISQKEMRFARTFKEVQQEVHDLIKGRILIGHDIKHDLEVLELSHPPRDIRDTSRHAAFKKHGHGRKPALRLLALNLLNIEIQEGAHSSIEDARVTMLLFRKDKSAFDVDHASRYAPAPSSTSKQQKKSRHSKTRRP